MRIIIDLDGTLCEFKNPTETYLDVKPKPKMKELVKKLKSEGHEIIIYTSRHMRTCNGNVELVKQKMENITKEWLKKEDIPYDELYFGKPYGDIIIDDMAINARNTESIKRELENLKINIVIPMAGKSERFFRAGYKIPKYLIDINGKIMLEHSLSGLPLDLSEQIIFIALTEHEKKYKITEKIQSVINKNYPYLKDKTHIILIDEVTRGQAETVLKAKDFINDEKGLLIFNIDSAFKSSRLRQRILASRFQEIDGIIGTFNSVEPKWSFVELDNNGYVIKTAEKEPISNLASTGLYYFKHGSEFVKYCEKMIKENLLVKNEFYVIPIYNLLIKDGKKIIIDPVEEFNCFGTPEDLEQYLLSKSNDNIKTK